MYAKPDYTTFTVDGMEILMVVLPVWKVTAEIYHSEMKTMMIKNLLGKNATKNIPCYF
jgi:hypothetical protein